MKPTLCLHLFLMVALTTAGCVPANLTPVLIQTKTYLPSPTVVPATSTPAPTPRATATLTPPATLAAEEVKETISKLLHEPVDCEAPCFWGIKPGETTLGEAENIFVRLGFQLKGATYEGKDFYGIRYDLDSGLSLLVTLTVQENIVTDLRVGITPGTQNGGDAREWSAYSPEMLIGRYGIPSKVNFVLDWGPQSLFAMEMYFDKFDLIVQYSVYGFIEETYPQVCPLSVPFGYIALWMGKEPIYPPRDVVLLEEATSLTLEQFSELMTRKPDEACFTLKPEAFQFP